MKTSITLSILGAYNALMGVLMLFSPDKMAITMIGANRAEKNPDLEHMATIFHYGLAPALLMIGLILIMIRKCDLGTAKKTLLAYVIATVVLLTLFFTVFLKSNVMDFSVEMAVPDMLALTLALFGYYKSK